MPWTYPHWAQKSIAGMWPFEFLDLLRVSALTSLLPLQNGNSISPLLNVSLNVHGRGDCRSVLYTRVLQVADQKSMISDA